MTKKRSRREMIAAVGATGLFGLSGCAQDDGGGDGDGDSGGGETTTTKTTTTEQTYTLKFADIFPEGHYLRSEWVVHFGDKVTELTDGQVQFEYFPAGTIGKAPQYVSMIKDGTLDMAYTVPAYYDDAFYLSGIAALPRQFTSPLQGAEAYWEILNPDDNGILFEEELKGMGLRPILGNTHVPYELLTADEGVKYDSVGFLKGKKIRSSGGIQSLAIKALGGEPIALGGPETGQAMSRGTVDGAIFPIPSMPAYDLQKSTKTISLNGNFNSSSQLCTMRLELWNEFSPSIKDAFRKASDSARLSLAKHLAGAEDKSIKNFKDLGINFYDIPSDVTPTVDQKLESVIDTWIQNQEDRGFPGQAVYEAWRSALKDAQ